MNRDIEAAWRYHNGTKLSWDIVHNISHDLDLSNKPIPFKIYPHLEAEKLPWDLPSGGVAILVLVLPPALWVRVVPRVRDCRPTGKSFGETPQSSVVPTRAWVCFKLDAGQNEKS